MTIRARNWFTGLLEYKRFKDVAEDLGEREVDARNIYPRGTIEISGNGFDQELLDNTDVTLFDLVASFKKILDRNKKVTIHRVVDISVTLEERLQFVRVKLTEQNEMLFAELFAIEDDKVVLIVTFIAILELIRDRFLQANQSETFGDITLLKLDEQRKPETSD